MSRKRIMQRGQIAMISPFCGVEGQLSNLWLKDLLKINEFLHVKYRTTKGFITKTNTVKTPFLYRCDSVFYKQFPESSGLKSLELLCNQN